MCFVKIDYRIDYQLLIKNVSKCVFLTLEQEKKKPADLLSQRVFLRGSNRTRTYDTPGMKRAATATVSPYVTSVPAFQISF